MFNNMIFRDRFVIVVRIMRIMSEKFVEAKSRSEVEPRELLSFYAL